MDLDAARHDTPVIIIADLDVWARQHWQTTHPWAERGRVVRVVR